MTDDAVRPPGSILLSLAEAMSPAVTVEDLRIGPFVTAVRTSAGTGVATTFVDHGREPAGPMVAMAGRLDGVSVRRLIHQAANGTTLERSIAVAAINSSLAERPAIDRDGNGFDLLVRLGAGKRVVFIGHFPFVDGDRGRSFASLHVFELPHRMKAGDRTADELPRLLGQADIAVITGTALVTHTLEAILGLCPKRCLRFMVGLTTPLSRVLFDRGLDVLCGTTVEDPVAVLRGAAQGATHKQLDGVKRVICIRPGLEIRDGD